MNLNRFFCPPLFRKRPIDPMRSGFESHLMDLMKVPSTAETLGTR